MKTNMKIVVTLALTLIGGLAHANSTLELARGEKAKALFDSLPSEARTLMLPPLQGAQRTQFKVYNLSVNGSNWSIQRGERGVICEHYNDEGVIKEAGTDYACALVDLSDKK